VHEMSVAIEVCRMAEERLTAQQLGQLVSVGLEVGDEAGLEPDNLSFCLEALFAHPPFAGAKPVITRTRGDDLRVSYLEVDDGRPGD
jgi:Zn finger protein HypA/HybF involved in hydrogenase expression